MYNELYTWVYEWDQYINQNLYLCIYRNSMYNIFIYIYIYTYVSIIWSVDVDKNMSLLGAGLDSKTLRDSKSQKVQGAWDYVSQDVSRTKRFRFTAFV